MKKLLTAIVIFSLVFLGSIAQAQPQGSFVDLFSQYFTPEFVAWLILVIVLGSMATYLARRGTALVLERKWRFSEWLAVGDRAIGMSIAISSAVAIFVLQPGVISDAKVLNFLPTWQTVLFIIFVGVVGSSGGADNEKRIVKAEEKAKITAKREVEEEEVKNEFSSTGS